LNECVWRLPSHTHIYLEVGAVLIGGLALEQGEGLKISGRGIREVLAENVQVLSGGGEEPSVIAGYSEEFSVKDIEIKDFYRDGRKAESLEQAGITVGEFAENVRIE